MSFLKAEWRKLGMVNYKVTSELLKPYVPEGTELDFYQDNCYVSLIGFMFKNTRLLGMKIPFHINFEEVNLRFYVRRKEEGVWKRGVVFIKEIVPKPTITFIANTIYNENYETLPMEHSWKIEDDKITVDYQWKTKSKWNKISVLAENEMIDMEPNSEIEFIAEHYWGYAKNGLKTTEYEVTHPSWKYYPVIEYKIDVNFEETYGTKFNILHETIPCSVFLLEGSEISVESKIEMT
ncbi:hypothetical protein SAMN04489761_3754 [Tenacibaculum sp. MAR_2009_124]|uniref:YqjF family protein n=1 Tax=Tenacibaculum sp. MAR_2009_124 TaxID=1250059 RepID=UPI0008954111|nr:DUF2071 domain-containing protein [Tenacibaculum sp. MAR_2009_124]SEC84603.1 hypothetical protein SAMN04489761_3754 [Tenacibaculum sp. MAR_2009_124]